MRFASLCSGIGGADLALEAHGHHAAWHAELDLAPAAIHTAHWPGLPNLGDITDIDWAACEPVDIISAGYPCPPFSLAGNRKGTDDDRHLWPHVRDAIGALRPRYAFLENVGGHFSLGAAIVVHDLAQIGYMSAWGSLGSSAVGGCHRRDRFWLLATDATNVGCERGGLTRDGWDGPPHGDRQPLTFLPTPTAGDGTGGHRATNLEWRGGTAYRPSGAKASVSLQEAMDLLPTPTARDHKGHNQRHDTSCLMGALELLPTPTAWLGRRPSRGDGDSARWLDTERSRELSDCIAHLMTTTVDFGRYQPAVDRWASIFGQPPAPTDHKGRLNPPFVEWMLGYPAGWVTDAGLSRSAELRALGNAQQPQVATAALSILGQRIDAMTRQEVLAS